MANELNLPLKIAVLVSPARHPISGTPMRSTSDAAAFELGCSLVPAQRLTVLCAGMVSRESLHDYLGLGVSEIEVLTVDPGADVVAALQARLTGFDVVLCGVRADGQSSSGLLPYLLAEGLQMPLISDVLEAEVEGRTVRVRQFLPKGMRRRLEASMPVLLAIHPRATQVRQFSYARACVGRVTYSAGSTQGSVPVAPGWQLEAASRRPQPLKAKIAQSGHARMLGAIGGEADARGGQFVTAGSAEQKAQALISYLREHHLVDF